MWVSLAASLLALLSSQTKTEGALFAPEWTGKAYRRGPVVFEQSYRLLKIQVPCGERFSRLQVLPP